MRLFILLCLLAETMFIGIAFGRIADHYEYLGNMYASSLQKCEEALNGRH